MIEVLSIFIFSDMLSPLILELISRDLEDLIARTETTPSSLDLPRIKKLLAPFVTVATG